MGKQYKVTYIGADLHNNGFNHCYAIIGAKDMRDKEGIENWKHPEFLVDAKDLAEKDAIIKELVEALELVHDVMTKDASIRPGDKTYCEVKHILNSPLLQAWRGK